MHVGLDEDLQFGKLLWLKRKLLLLPARGKMLPIGAMPKAETVQISFNIENSALKNR